MSGQTVPNTEGNFEAIRDAVAKRGAEVALGELAERLRAEQRYHEFFESHLMLCRHRAGLPLGSDFQLDAISSPLRETLEQSYLDACRETGKLFLEAGQLREAWMYLRTVDDRTMMRKSLAEMEVNSQNIDSVLEIAIYEGVDVALGFKHLLTEMGTCNAITTYESVMPTRSLAERRLVAGLLIDHLHQELVSNFSGALGVNTEGVNSATDALATLLKNCQEQFGEYTVHVDASHLSSIVRMAEVVENRTALERALDLTHYGKRLHANFHFPGPPPFEDPYESHRLLFAAQLGMEVEEAIAYFRNRAEQTREEERGSWPAEIYVLLLSRLSRDREALEARIEYFKVARSAEAVAPSLLELAERSGQYDRLLEFLEIEGDLLTFAASLIEQQAAPTNALKTRAP